MGGNVSSTRPHPPPQRIDETYMTQHNLPDIPQEIIDEIIDRCAEDKRTLIACSLTSRTWVYRTRKHLFSKLTLTDETLPIWCGIVATPAKGSRNQPRLVPGSHPPPSSSYAPSWVSFHITSLQLVPKYTPDSKNQLGVYELLQAKSHLSAFINLKSLTLTALVFTTFDDASLKACFGSLAETVSELKLSVCLLDEERFFALARMFTGLESLEVNGNVWNESASVGETESLEKDLPTLRGSFTASQIIGNVGLLESLATAKAEYHTITLGWNHPSTFPKFNALFARSKDHLRTLILTRPEQDVGSKSPFSAWVLPTQPDQANHTFSRKSNRIGSGSFALRETSGDTSDVCPCRIWDDHPNTQDHHFPSVEEVDILHHPSPTYGQPRLGEIGPGDGCARKTRYPDGQERYAPSFVLFALHDLWWAQVFRY